MDPDPDPGDPKTYGSDGSGPATLQKRLYLTYHGQLVLLLSNLATSSRYLKTTISYHRSTVLSPCLDSARACVER
jgi:hypothetical protein